MYALNIKLESWSQQIKEPVVLSWLFFLPCVTFILFYSVVDFEFVWDDQYLHFANSFVREPKFETLRELWLAPYYGLYIPMAYTVWGGLTAFFGLSTTIFHGANLWVHIINVELVFLFLLRFNQPVSMVGLVALIFALHPIQVESVAWCSDLRGLFSVSFGLLALMLLINQPNSPRYFRGLVASICFIMALLFKPLAVVFLPLSILLQWYGLKRPFWQTMMQHLPWLVVLLMVLYMTWQGHRLGVIPESEILLRPLIWMDALIFYLQKLIFPLELAATYARTPAYVLSQAWIHSLWLCLVCLCAWLIWSYQRPILFFTSAWFLIGFLPASGLIPFAFQNYSTVADRYMYIPMIGVCLLLLVGFNWLHERFQRISLFPVGLLVIALAYQTYNVQLPTWRNMKTLWSHTVEVTPNAPQAWHDLGLVYRLEGNDQAAEVAFKKSLFADLKYADSYLALAELYRDQNKPGLALDYYNQALQNKPTYWQAALSRATLLFDQQRYLDAVRDYEFVLQFRPRQASTHYNRAVALFYLQQIDAAQAGLNLAIQLGYDPAMVVPLQQAINAAQ